VRSSSKESLQASLQAIKFGINQEADQVSLLSNSKSQHHSFASRAEQVAKKADGDDGGSQDLQNHHARDEDALEVATLTQKSDD